jgi:molybdopterin-containing oxidoreductase family iron-sulfur binding subunit
MSAAVLWAQLPTFDIGNSRYVLAFGADFLGTWNSPVTQSVGYGEMRHGKLQNKPVQRGKFVQFESRMSQTGANADEWIPINPGTEGVLALGLAHVIMKEHSYKPEAAGVAGSQIAGWSSGTRMVAAVFSRTVGYIAKKLAVNSAVVPSV